VQIEAYRLAGSLVVRLKGEFDLHAAEIFRREVDDALERSPECDLIVDLCDTTFIDSSGLGALLGRYKRLSPRGRTMSLAGPAHQVEQILGLSGIKRIMAVYPSVDKALSVSKSRGDSPNAGG